VKLFTTRGCGLCHSVKKLLARARVRYVEYDVSTPEGLAKYCDVREGGHSALPLLVEDNTHYYGENAVVRAVEILEGQRTFEVEMIQ